ncbi:LysR family transcriptional regulator [Pectobacterium actinidiae]|uniref:LysR family transcriptional regulator n=1 Tax=Pectobacterium actinidiae TaxID=1507808 RepID=UPI0038199021
MELRQLRALLAIAETGSVTKASNLLHVVQPAISRQVRLLEQELGKSLFVRTRSGMEATEEGKLLIESARRALLALDQAVAEIKPSRGTIAGLVSVGFLPSVCDLIAGDLLADVRRAYPHIRLRLTTGYPGQLQNLLEGGMLDLAIYYDPKDHPAVDTSALLDEPLFLVWNNELLPHSWDGPQPLSVLGNLPLILPSSSHSVRGVIEHACVIENVPLNIVAEADATQLTKTLVLAGAGHTVLAGVAIADPALRDKVHSVPIGDPLLQRRITLTASSPRRKSAPVQCVSSILRSLVRRVVTDGAWPGARLVELPSTAK